MADDVDRASEEQAVYEAAILAAMAKEAAKPIQGSKFCLHCGEDLIQDAALPKRFCDADCRDDWEADQ